MKINFKTWIAVLILGLVTSFGALGKVAYINWQLRDTNEQLNKELMQANLEIGRAKTEFGNAGKYIKSLEEKVQEEIKARNAAITRIGWFRGQLKIAKKLIIGTKNNQEVVYIDKEILIERLSPRSDFKKGMIYQATGPDSLIVLGEVIQKIEDHRLVLHITVRPTPNKYMQIPIEATYRLRMNFRGEITETLLPSGGRNFYLNLWETHQGKDISKFQLQNFNVIINDQRKPSLMWAPHLDIGITPFWELTAKEFRTGGSFGLSMLGLGITKNDLSWRFLRLSLEVQKNFGFGCSPVLFNIGSTNVISLISNIYLGPNVIWFLNNKWATGLFLGGVI